MPDAARHSFPRIGGAMAAIYSLACLLLSFVMGAALQVKSAVDSGAVTFGTDRRIIVLVMVAAVALAVVGRGKYIGKITLYIIPLTTIIYITVALSTVFVNASALPQVISTVISEAFSPCAGLGGLLGFFTSAAVREGFSRGMLSNEAGAGTSSLGHTTGASLDPATRGLLGVLEVVFDTTVLCTLSGLAILVGAPTGDGAQGGMQLILSAVTGSLGKYAAAAVALSVFAFAYSTVLCWYYYGRASLSRLVGAKYTPVFFPLFLSFVALGAFLSEALLILLSDLLLLVLSLITLPTLIKNSDRIVLLSESGGFLKLKESDPRKRSDTE